MEYRSSTLLHDLFRFIHHSHGSDLCLIIKYRLHLAPNFNANVKRPRTNYAKNNLGSHTAVAFRMFNWRSVCWQLRRSSINGLASSRHGAFIERCAHTRRGALDKLPKKFDLPRPINNRIFDGNREQAVLNLDEIKVYGTIEPEDIKKPDKSQIAKLRDFLDKTGKSHTPIFTETVGADGSCVVRISTAGRTYWIEESRGQVDWLDVNAKKIATNCWGSCR